MAQVYGEPLAADASPFIKRRRTGIGGSDAAAILGVSPWGSALSVWEEKRGLGPPDESKDIMVWGSRLEAAVRDGYAEDVGMPVHRVGFRRSKVRDFVIGHPDGEREDRRGLEIKVVQGLGDQWGEPGSDEIPAHYYAQVQHYEYLMGWDVADVAALVRARQLSVYTIPRNEAFIDAMLDEEAEFWHLVQTGTPPEPDGSDSAGQALRRMFPRAVEDSIIATPVVAEYAQDYLDAKVREEAAAKDKALAQQRIEKFMGHRERLVGDGFTVRWGNVDGSVSWKQVASAYRKVIEDWDDSEHPIDLDIIEGLYRSEPSRRFGGVKPKEDK